MDFKFLAIILVIGNLFLLMVVTDAARILGIFPMKAKSHYLFNEMIMRILANAGHEVTIFAPFPPTKPMANIKIIDSDVTKLNPMWTAVNSGILKFISSTFTVMQQDCEDLLKMKEFQDILHSTERQYDILFLEMVSFYECYSPLAEKLNIPIIARSNVPNSVEIGGLRVKSIQREPLHESLQTFIDEATHGVIILSMGSIGNNDHLVANVSTIFKNVFARIPQRVIWKSEITIDDLSANVHVARWLPQIEILRHKNVKAFITHCGLNSIYEGIHFATPMILMPVHTDQNYNARVVEKNGAGIQINMSNITEELLQNAIDSVINDTKYRKNVEDLSRIFNDQQVPPNDTVVYWTEYVLKYNGAPHLRTTAADMPLYQYLLLDVLLFIFLVSFLLVKIVAKILCVLLCKNSKADERKKIKQKRN